MAKLLQLRRGNTSAHGTFTGAVGEVTIDTEKDVPVVHDGSTQGGHPVAAEDMSNVSSASIVSRIGNSHLAGVKVQPNFGSQNVETTGTLSSGDITISDNSPKLTFTDGDQDPDYEILVDGGAFAIRSGGSNRIRVKSDNDVDITGNLDVGAGVDVTGDSEFIGDVKFDGATAGRDILFDRSLDKLHFSDNAVAAFGDGSDVQIYHNGTAGYIDSAGNDTLFIRNGTTGGKIKIQGNSGEESIIANHDGSVELYYDDDKKLETDTSGSVITGRLAFNNTGSSIQLADDQKVAFGAGQDLQIYHDGTDNLLAASNGSIKLSAAGYYINNADNSHNFIRCENVSSNNLVSLHFNNSKKFETTNTGVSVTGALVASGDVTAFSDQTLKKDITTINDALGLCGKLRGVSYKWIKDDKPSIGVIAQEIEAHIPEIVSTTQLDGKDVKSVDYGKIVGVLINAVNELKAELDEYKATFETIKMQDLGAMDGDVVLQKILVLKKES